MRGSNLELVRSGVLQLRIHRQCWPKDFKDRLVPRSQLGSIQGNEKHKTHPHQGWVLC